MWNMYLQDGHLLLSYRATDYGTPSVYLVEADMPGSNYAMFTTVKALYQQFIASMYRRAIKMENK